MKASIKNTEKTLELTKEPAFLNGTRDILDILAAKNMEHKVEELVLPKEN